MVAFQLGQSVDILPCLFLCLAYRIETVQDLQNVLKKQTDQFQEMMQAMGKMFQQKPSKSK